MSWIIKPGIVILNCLYWLFKRLPSQKKAIMLSRQGDTPSIDMQMLSDKIADLHPDFQVFLLCKKLDGGLGKKICYLLHMFRQMYHLATAEIVILDSYCIAASVLRHKKNLLIVQMWHSIGTMKKFGYSILDKPEGNASRVARLMKMHANYDYILAAGDGYRAHLAEGFNYPAEKIITMPLPRVELLKNAAYGEKVRAQIFSTYPPLATKKNIVYVPTFRKADDADFLKALAELCQAVDYENYNLIIKAHPLTDLSDFQSGKAIVDHSFSSFEMLFAGDLVISDYSCIMYEAAILKKPIYLYAYDYEEYMTTRDIYMDYRQEVPGPICETAAQLITEIETDTYDEEKLAHFLNKYVYMGSRHETEDIVDFIFCHTKN